MGITRLDGVINTIVTDKKALSRSQGLVVVKKVNKKMQKASDSVNIPW
jgi:hypothetical protein